ncbi:putative immune-type receptor 6b precursor [Silurus meridionalis]|nr:putative immune-type receptor 6b precursor [Silurus meridionalis]
MKRQPSSASGKTRKSAALSRGSCSAAPRPRDDIMDFLDRFSQGLQVSAALPQDLLVNSSLFQNVPFSIFIAVPEHSSDRAKAHKFGSQLHEEICSLLTVNMIDKEQFLKRHWDEIIQKTRNPIQLADTLRAKRYISEEMFENINNKKTKQDKMREVYSNLNSNKHFDCIYDCLMKHESYLLKELDKRARLEGEDETDNNLTQPSESEPDLRKISTFAKLEYWISQPDNNQKLVSDLERKLGEKAMEDLRNELRDKESKNTLCFDANNIDEIRKNKELESFFSTKKNAKFPKLAIGMFFKKSSSASSANANESFAGCDESMDITDLDSSGYGSLLSSSLIDGSPRHNVDFFPQNDRRSEDQNQCSDPGDTNIMIGKTDLEIEEKVNNECQPQKSNGPMCTDVSLLQSISQKGTSPAENCGNINMQNVHIGGIDDESQKLNVPNVPALDDESLQQNDQTFTKETPLAERCGNMNMQDTHNGEKDNEPQRSNVLHVPKKEDVSLHQNESVVMKDTPRDERFGSTDMQYKHSHRKPLRVDVPMQEDVSLLQNVSFTQKETPQELRLEEKIPLADGTGSTDMKEPYTDNIFEGPQRSDVPMHQNESITKNKIPVEDGFERTDMQGEHSHEKPQRVDVSMHEDLSLYQNVLITKKQTPQEDGLGHMNMQDVHNDEMEVEPQRLNFLTSEDVILHQNNQKENPLADGTGSTDIKEPYTDNIYEEPQRSDVPMHQNESITKNETSLEDGFGNTDMEEMQIDKMEYEPQPQKSNDRMYDASLLQKKMLLADRCEIMKMQNRHTQEIQDQPQKLSVPKHDDESLHIYYKITTEEAPRDKRFGSTDMQDEHSHEKPQRADVPMQENVSLLQYVLITKKETPQQDGLGYMNIQDVHNDEMEVDSQRSDVLMSEDVILHQNDQKEMPLADETESTDMKEPYTDKINEEPQRSDVSMQKDVSLLQNVLITKKETPLTERCGNINLEETHTGQINDEPPTSNVPCVPNKDVSLQQHESIVMKDTPRDERFGCTDMQDVNSHEKPQRVDVPMQEGVSLLQNVLITEKETPQEDGLGCMNMQDVHNDEMVVGPQRSNVHLRTSEDVILHQNDQKENPLADGTGRTDMKESYTDNIYEEPQRSDVPMHQNESITKNEKPVENGLGRTDEEEIDTEKEDDDDPQKSNVPLHENVPNSITEMLKPTRYGNMKMLPNEQTEMQICPEHFSVMEMSSPGLSGENTQKQNNGAGDLGAGVLGEPPKVPKKRKYTKNLKEKKKKDKDTWLREWALKQCHGHKDLKNILDQISIIDMAEHSDYPCFIAERVMVYKYLTPENQILFIAEDNTSIRTKTMVHYHMFVCNIKKAILLGPKPPKEQELEYDESKVPLEKSKTSDIKELHVETVKRGEDVTIECNLSMIKDKIHLAWYKQSFGKVPQFLAKPYSNNLGYTFDSEFADIRYSITVNDRQFDLNINDTREEDSGEYFCGEMEGNMIRFTAGTRLEIEGKQITVVLR